MIILFCLSNQSGSDCSCCLAFMDSDSDGHSEIPGNDSDRGEVAWPRSLRAGLAARPRAP